MLKDITGASRKVLGKAGFEPARGGFDFVGGDNRILFRHLLIQAQDLYFISAVHLRYLPPVVSPTLARLPFRHSPIKISIPHIIEQQFNLFLAPFDCRLSWEVIEFQHAGFKTFGYNNADLYQLSPAESCRTLFWSFHQWTTSPVISDLLRTIYSPHIIAVTYGSSGKRKLFEGFIWLGMRSGGGSLKYIDAPIITKPIRKATRKAITISLSSLSIFFFIPILLRLIKAVTVRSKVCDPLSSIQSCSLPVVF